MAVFTWASHVPLNCSENWRYMATVEVWLRHPTMCIGLHLGLNWTHKAWWLESFTVHLFNTWSLPNHDTGLPCTLRGEYGRLTNYCRQSAIHLIMTHVAYAWLHVYTYDWSYESAHDIVPESQSSRIRIIITIIIIILIIIRLTTITIIIIIHYYYYYYYPPYYN